MGQIRELVRGSVEETLNELLEAEAAKLTQQQDTSAMKPGRATVAVIMTET